MQKTQTRSVEHLLDQDTKFSFWSTRMATTHHRYSCECAQCQFVAIVEGDTSLLTPAEINRRRTNMGLPTLVGTHN